MTCVALANKRDVALKTFSSSVHVVLAAGTSSCDVLGAQYRVQMYRSWLRAPHQNRPPSPVLPRYICTGVVNQENPTQQPAFANAESTEAREKSIVNSWLACRPCGSVTRDRNV